MRRRDFIAGHTFCIAPCFFAPRPQWVKSRLPVQRSDVSFRRVRTWAERRGGGPQRRGAILPAPGGCRHFPDRATGGNRAQHTVGTVKTRLTLGPGLGLGYRCAGARYAITR
jgi:hypothetical protein